MQNKFCKPKKFKKKFFLQKKVDKKFEKIKILKKK